MRLTIKLQLALAFGFVIVLLLVGNLFGMNSLSRSNREMDAMVSGPTARLEAAQQLNIHLLNMVRTEKNMILVGSPEEVTKLETSIDKERQAFEALLNKTEGLATAEGKPKWQALGGAFEQLMDVHGRVLQLALESRDAEASALSMGEGRKAVSEAGARADELVELSKAQLDEASERADVDFAATRNMLIGVSVISLLAAAGAATYIAMLVSKGLARASEAVRTVADGDLTKTVEITTRDEIGDLLGHVNVMIDRLRGIVADAISASENVSAGSQELSATSEQMSQGATEQASAAEQASASMEEMAANIKQNADNA
ncbi:methyl-accepting chemotaxis protein, partial [Caulobacter sp.]|uniref:methyl-accepting chemotaxis protein n=1 Tax=Caulobacter sp. TaxID=78 RepID=UPI002B4858FD